MARYAIEVYELHAQVYYVTAESVEGALNAYENGEGEESTNAPNYLQVAEEYGFLVVGDTKARGIRNITEATGIENDDPANEENEDEVIDGT